MKVRHVFASLLVVALLSAAANADLIHRYSFKSGTAKDSVGSVDATLKGDAKITDGKLVLDNGDKTSGDTALSYLDFGASILPKSGQSVSLVVWFNAKQNSAFARILNIGDKTDAEGQAFIYLTPRNADDMCRAAITATDAAHKTNIDTDPVDDGKDHMIALVVNGTDKKLHLFIDGKEPVAAADLNDNTLDKVKTTNNWIGRSSFDADAGLSASISEVRVYDNALTLDQAAAMFKAGPDAAP